MAWILVGAAAWVVVAATAAVLVGRMIRMRDAQVPPEAAKPAAVEPSGPPGPSGLPRHRRSSDDPLRRT